MRRAVPLLLAAALSGAPVSAQGLRGAIDDYAMLLADVCATFTRLPPEGPPPSLDGLGLVFGAEGAAGEQFATLVANYFAARIESPGSDAQSPWDQAMGLGQRTLASRMANSRPGFPYYARTWIYVSPDAAFTHALFENEAPPRAYCEAFVTGRLSPGGADVVMSSVLGGTMHCDPPRSRSTGTTRFWCEWAGGARDFWVELIANTGRSYADGRTVPPNVKMMMMYQAPEGT